MTGRQGDDSATDDPTADDSAAGGADGVTAEYRETEAERLLVFSAGDRVATIAQNREGYAMLSVRTRPDGDERERYYGLEMALDHAAELLGRRPSALPVPDAASDMGM